jgi:lysophospholipase L1-like esterase
MGYRRFVVLGDSCAEGLDDPYPGGDTYRGWADLVADRLAGLHPVLCYANLAVRGRRLDQIMAEQFDAAARLRPDLVALFGGGNDVLSMKFDPVVVSGRVDRAVSRLCELAPTAVVFTISDLSGRMPIVRGLRSRLAVLNVAYRRAAHRYGALLVDLEPDEAVRDLRYFGRDRLHLSEHGHRRVAARVLDRLGQPYDPQWLAPLPGSLTRLGLREQAEWLWQEVLPVAISRVRNQFTGRSPGDGFLPKRPDLLPVVSAQSR